LSWELITLTWPHGTVCFTLVAFFRSEKLSKPLEISTRYGVSEILLSDALKDYPRSSYYLATKVGRYSSDKPCNEWFDFSYKRTIESVENSLQLFGTDYIDLMQVIEIGY